MSERLAVAMTWADKQTDADRISLIDGVVELEYQNDEPTEFSPSDLPTEWAIDSIKITEDGTTAIHLIEEDSPAPTSRAPDREGELMPVRWMFEKEGRASLVQYALEAVVQDEVTSLNKTELGERAETSRHSVHRHLDELVAYGIYEEGTSGRMNLYQPVAESTILTELARVNEVCSVNSSRAPKVFEQSGEGQS